MHGSLLLFIFTLLYNIIPELLAPHSNVLAIIHRFPVSHSPYFQQQCALSSLLSLKLSIVCFTKEAGTIYHQAISVASAFKMS